MVYVGEQYWSRDRGRITPEVAMKELIARLNLAQKQSEIQDALDTEKLRGKIVQEGIAQEKRAKTAEAIKKAYPDYFEKTWAPQQAQGEAKKAAKIQDLIREYNARTGQKPPEAAGGAGQPQGKQPIAEPAPPMPSNISPASGFGAPPVGPPQPEVWSPERQLSAEQDWNALNKAIQDVDAKIKMQNEALSDLGKPDPEDKEQMAEIQGIWDALSQFTDEKRRLTGYWKAQRQALAEQQGAIEGLGKYNTQAAYAEQQRRIQETEIARQGQTAENAKKIADAAKAQAQAAEEQRIGRLTPAQRAAEAEGLAAAKTRGAESEREKGRIAAEIRRREREAAIFLRKATRDDKVRELLRNDKRTAQEEKDLRFLEKEAHGEEQQENEDRSDDDIRKNNIEQRDIQDLIDEEEPGSKKEIRLQRNLKKLETAKTQLWADRKKKREEAFLTFRAKYRKQLEVEEKVSPETLPPVTEKETPISKREEFKNRLMSFSRDDRIDDFGLRLGVRHPWLDDAFGKNWWASGDAEYKHSLLQNYYDALLLEGTPEALNLAKDFETLGFQIDQEYPLGRTLSETSRKTKEQYATRPPEQTPEVQGWLKEVNKAVSEKYLTLLRQAGMDEERIRARQADWKKASDVAREQMLESAKTLARESANK